MYKKRQVSSSSLHYRSRRSYKRSRAIKIIALLIHLAGILVVLMQLPETHQMLQILHTLIQPY